MTKHLENFKISNMKNLLIIVFIALLFSCVQAQSGTAEKFTIQNYLNIRAASSPQFSPDNKRVAFLSNQSGTNQIYIVAATGDEPKQLTSYEDNISFLRFAPASETILFGKAQGGDENAQLFIMNADGSNVRQLTNAPEVRHNFGDFSKDGARVFYASNKRDRNYFDVYAMDLASGKETLIYQQNGSNAVAAVSPDSKLLIVSRAGTELSLDNDLYLIDARTGRELELLTKHASAARFGDVHFAPDSTFENISFYYGTDQNREFYGLGRMQMTSFKTGKQFLNELTQDVDASELSRDGKTLAYVYNREGFSELRVGETASFSDNGLLTKDLPVLPAKGVVGGLNFSPDGSKLALTFSSAKNNPDIWIYDLKAKSFAQLTNSDRAGLAAESFVEPELVKFKSFDGREIPAWLYKPQITSSPSASVVSEPPGIPDRYTTTQANSIAQPKLAADVSGSSKSKSLPVIISVHGGPEGQERPSFNALYQYYLSRGYAVLATNVRGSTGYGKTFTHLDDVEKREDSVKDLAAAAEYLKDSGAADPRRIAVIGGSYGGYMTMAAITLYPDLFAAAVNTVGIVNWETFLKNTSGYRRRQREVEYGRLDKDLEFLRRTSPISKVDRIKTPLMVIHGKRDPRVPYTEAEQLVEALRKRDATVEYKLFDDEGHGISKLKNRLIVYPLVADFLDKHLR